MIIDEVNHMESHFFLLITQHCHYWSKFELNECTTMYFKGRVTLFVANNYLTEYRITMEF